MKLTCPACQGATNSRCGYCAGTGQVSLSLRQRKEMAVEVLERNADLGCIHNRLYLRIVAKAVEDIGGSNDSTAEILNGGVDGFLHQLELSPEFLMEVLEQAGLVTDEDRYQLPIPFPSD